MPNLQHHISLADILGMPKSREDVLRDLKSDPDLFSSFEKLPAKNQEDLLRFLMGEKSVEILYDSFFKSIMDPNIHPERLEGLISVLLDQPVSIKQILPNNGTRLVDNGSFVIMDILVELSDNRIVDVEMQKIGYQFPAQRTSCYAADIIMRQYNRVRALKQKDFTYKDIKDTFLFIIMEDSSTEFLHASPSYIHTRTTAYNSGVILPEITHITYISLDIFRSAVHNIDTELEAWLTFLCKDDPASVLSLVNRYPKFLPCYSDIAAFRQKPEEVINMFSEALYILDRNTERYMVDELKQQINEQKAELDEKDALLGKKDALLSKKNAMLAEKDSLLAKYREQFGDLES